jgi:hypothetical protein
LEFSIDDDDSSYDESCDTGSSEDCELVDSDESDEANNNVEDAFVNLEEKVQ